MKPNEPGKTLEVTISVSEGMLADIMQELLIEKAMGGLTPEIDPVQALALRVLKAAGMIEAAPAKAKGPAGKTKTRAKRKSR